jgi:hypothetical protein
LGEGGGGDESGGGGRCGGVKVCGVGNDCGAIDVGEGDDVVKVEEAEDWVVAVHVENLWGEMGVGVCFDGFVVCSVRREKSKGKIGKIYSPWAAAILYITLAILHFLFSHL